MSAKQILDTNDSFDFEVGESGASKSFPVQSSSLRKNGYVLLKDRPCKIVEMSTSKTGKHGHAKVNFVGIDIFTGKKYETSCQSTHNMMVPVIIRKEYTLIDISDDEFLSLFDSEKNETRDDIKLPDDELGETIRNKFDNLDNIKLVVLKSGNDEAVVSFRVQD